MTSSHKNRRSITAAQTETVLGVLQPSGEEWMSTRGVADETPWSVGTVRDRLNDAHAADLVERRPCASFTLWRLPQPEEPIR